MANYCKLGTAKCCLGVQNHVPVHISVAVVFIMHRASQKRLVARVDSLSHMFRVPQHDGKRGREYRHNISGDKLKLNSD